MRLRIGIGACLLALLLQLGSFIVPKPSATSAYAVLLQPNLDVGVDNRMGWSGVGRATSRGSWSRVRSNCSSAILGMPYDRKDPTMPSMRREYATAGSDRMAGSSVAVRERRSTHLTLASANHCNNQSCALVALECLAMMTPETYNSGVFTAPDGNIHRTVRQDSSRTLRRIRSVPRSLFLREDS